MTTLPLEPWPDPASAVGKQFFEGALACFLAWKAKGVATPFAIGMVAQAEAESSFDPNACGDKDTAFGLYQVHPDRCAAIEAGTGINLIALVKAKKCTIQNCVDAAWWEFNKMHWTGMSAIASQKTAQGAAYQACILFERASAPGAAERRGEMGTRWTPHFHAKGF